MLTPALEKLILNGKASYNTFVVGGSQKYVLNVKPDHYIIIIGIHYQSIVQAKIVTEALYTYGEINNLLTNNLNTQLKIFSNKSQNTFLFRNNFDIIKYGLFPEPYLDYYFINPKGHTNLDLYLVHESDVSFTFSNAGTTEDILTDYTPDSSIGYSFPFDYGKESQANKQKVRLVTSDSLSGDQMFPIGTEYQSLEINPNIANLEFIFPVDALHDLKELNGPANYPAVNVQYVEIKGRINNIEATL